MWSKCSEDVLFERPVHDAAATICWLDRQAAKGNSRVGNLGPIPGHACLVAVKNW